MIIHYTKTPNCVAPNTTRPITFEDVRAGDLFRCDDTLFIRIEGSEPNAVSLDNGRLYCIPSSERVSLYIGAVDVGEEDFIDETSL